MPAPGADFSVVAEVVVRVLARGGGRRKRRVRRRARGDEERGAVGRFGLGVGGRARRRRGDHFVVSGVVVGVAAGGVDGDEVVALVEGAADQVEPAEEHGGSAYEEQSPYAIELKGEVSIKALIFCRLDALTESRTKAAMTVPSFATNPEFFTLSKHGVLSPPLKTKQSSHGSALSRWCLAAVTVLSIWTKTIDKNTTFMIMMSTIAVPRHCNPMTFFTLRYACPAVTVLTLPLRDE